MTIQKQVNTADQKYGIAIEYSRHNVSALGLHQVYRKNWLGV